MKSYTITIQAKKRQVNTVEDLAQLVVGLKNAKMDFTITYPDGTNEHHEFQEK